MFWHSVCFEFPPYYSTKLCTHTNFMKQKKKHFFSSLYGIDRKRIENSRIMAKKKNQRKGFLFFHRRQRKNIRSFHNTTHTNNARTKNQCSRTVRIKRIEILNSEFKGKIVHFSFMQKSVLIISICWKQFINAIVYLLNCCCLLLLSIW